MAPWLCLSTMRLWWCGLAGGLSFRACCGFRCVTIKSSFLQQNCFMQHSSFDHSWARGCLMHLRDWMHYFNQYCHLGWRTLVLKCNKNNYDWLTQPATDCYLFLFFISCIHVCNICTSIYVRTELVNNEIQSTKTIWFDLKKKLLTRTCVRSGWNALSPVLSLWRYGMFSCIYVYITRFCPRYYLFGDTVRSHVCMYISRILKRECQRWYGLSLQPWLKG